MADNADSKEVKNDGNKVAKEEDKPASKKGKKIRFLWWFIVILSISFLLTAVIYFFSEKLSPATDNTSQESTQKKDSTAAQEKDSTVTQEKDSTATQEKDSASHEPSTSTATQSNTSDKQQLSNSLHQSSETLSSPPETTSPEKVPSEEEKKLSAKPKPADSSTSKNIPQQSEVKEEKKIAWIRFSDHLLKLEEQRGETFKVLLKTFPPQHFAAQPPLEQRLEFHALSNVKIKPTPTKHSSNSQPISVLDWQTLIKHLVSLEKQKEELIQTFTTQFPQSFPKKALVNTTQPVSQDDDNSMLSPIAPLSSPTITPSAQSSESFSTQPSPAMSAQPPVVTVLSSPSSPMTHQTSNKEDWAMVVQQLIAIEENRQELSVILEKMGL